MVKEKRQIMKRRSPSSFPLKPIWLNNLSPYDDESSDEAYNNGDSNGTEEEMQK